MEKKRREKGSAETGPSTRHSGGTGSPGTGTARHSSTVASEIAPKKRAASPRPSLASVLAEGEVHRQTSSTRIGAMVAAKTRAAAAADCSDPSSGVSGSGNAGTVADSQSLLPLRPTRETRERQGERVRIHAFPDMPQHQLLQCEWLLSTCADVGGHLLLEKEIKVTRWRFVIFISRSEAHIDRPS